jgi:hypothetical protein
MYILYKGHFLPTLLQKNVSLQDIARPHTPTPTLFFLPAAHVLTDCKKNGMNAEKRHTFLEKQKKQKLENLR